MEGLAAAHMLHLKTEAKTAAATNTGEGFIHRPVSFVNTFQIVTISYTKTELRTRHKKYIMSVKQSVSRYTHSYQDYGIFLSLDDI